MGKFSSGSYRREREVRGTPDGKADPRNIWAHSTLGGFIEHGEGGKKELNWEGRTELKKRRAAELGRRGDVAKALLRRKRHNALAALFKKPSPISFKTKDGKRVRILRHGFENMFIDTPKVSPRSLVCVFVNGERLFFYKSSGESSNLRGEWFPTLGPEVYHPHDAGEKLILGHLTKMDGHPLPRQQNPKTHFAPWVDEIRAQLKAHEQKIILHADWGAQSYVDMLALLGKIPSSRALNVSQH